MTFGAGVECLLDAGGVEGGFFVLCGLVGLGDVGAAGA